MKTANSTKSAKSPAAAARALNRRKFFKDMRKDYELYIMILPVLAFYIIFCYIPMYGVLMAFQDYKPLLGISGSEWVGFEHFKTFLTSVHFGRVFKNTLTISITTLIFNFPAPIILALLLNEVKTKWFKKTVQTITYMPHFISLVIVCGIVHDFTSDAGIVTQIANVFGYDGKSMLSKPELFVPIYVLSGIWQEVGWGSIIYLAALAGVDAQLYEAASIDGAGKFKQLIHITLPSILPTIIILFIMRMGQMLTVGYEKILLLYNQGIYETADVISTYVYRMGIKNASYSASTAIGLFNSIINIILLVITNKISSAVSETSLF